MGTWDDITAAAKPLADAVDDRATAAELEAEALRYVLTVAEGDVAAAQSRNADLEAQVAALTPNLKPGLRGLITTDPDYLDNIPYAEYGSRKPTWESCNPAQGIYNWTAIDNMLAAHPNIKFRLRFMAGIKAPQWLKDIVGTVTHVPDQGNGAPGEVPKYWTDVYFGHFANFMRAAAERYEDSPQVIEVANNYTTTAYAEPFILAADTASITRYWNAGLNRDKHELYLRKSIALMMNLFPTTRISLAGHSKWQYIENGALKTSWELERTILNELSATYGPRLVLEDHGLGPDDVAPIGQPRETASSWYAYMAGLHTTEQTYGWQFTLNEGSMPIAADMGVGMGACFLEYAAFQALDVTKRRQVHDALIANAAAKP